MSGGNQAVAAIVSRATDNEYSVGSTPTVSGHLFGRIGTSNYLCTTETWKGEREGGREKEKEREREQERKRKRERKRARKKERESYIRERKRWSRRSEVKMEEDYKV